MCIALAAIPAMIAGAASSVGSAAAAAGAAVGITSTAGALAATSAAAGLVGTGVSAYGSIQSSNAQAAAANYSAKTSVQQGQSAVDAARINEQQTYREGDQLEGRQRAAEGASGIDLNSGTALLTQTDTGTRTGQNVADQNYNAQLAQWGTINNSALLSSQAKSDQAAGGISAAGSLLSGASQVSNKWASWLPTGVFSGPGIGG